MPADLTRVPSAHKNKNPKVSNTPAVGATTAQGAATRGHGAVNVRVGGSHSHFHGSTRVPSAGHQR